MSLNAGARPRRDAPDRLLVARDRVSPIAEYTCDPAGIRDGFGGCWERGLMNEFPCLIRSSSPGGEVVYALGDPLVDSYLAFVAGRCRANTLRAVAHDLKTFFAVVDKAPVDVVAADVFAFVANQRGDRSVVRITDGESGLSARTIARRLSSISGLYAYLVARGDTAVTSNPVPRGLSTRRRGGRRRQVPLVRVRARSRRFSRPVR